MKKLKILVIDDKQIIGDVFNMTVADKGHDVVWEKDIDNAMDIIKNAKFDIVFLDIIMPDDDGIEVLKKIKEFSPDLPVVMMSGYSVEEKRHQAMVLGADALLKKPFAYQDIQKIIKELLGEDV